MSSPAWDERGWGGFGACAIASPALFLMAGFLLYICVCVCVYIGMCVCMENKAQAWGVVSPAVWPHCGVSQPCVGMLSAAGCSVLHHLLPRQRNGVYFWSCSPGWHVCTQAGVCYFIAACFRAGLGSRVSARGFPCFWTVVAVCAAQVSLPGGARVVVLGWVLAGARCYLSAAPWGLGAAWFKMRASGGAAVPLAAR